MTEQEKALLLNEVKNYLRITWTEEDSEIESLIERSIAYFNIRGIDVNFIEHKMAQQLLLDRCRYVRNYKAEEFEDNFLSDILNLQTSLLDSGGEESGS